MLTSCNHIQRVGEVTCVCVCRKSCLHVLVSWFYFHRTNPRLEGSYRVFWASLSQEARLWKPDTLILRNNSGNIGQFIGKISTLSGRLQIRVASGLHTRPHTHTHTPHICHPVWELLQRLHWRGYSGLTREAATGDSDRLPLSLSRWSKARAPWWSFWEMSLPPLIRIM